MISPKKIIPLYQIVDELHIAEGMALIFAENTEKPCECDMMDEALKNNRIVVRDGRAFYLEVDAWGIRWTVVNICPFCHQKLKT